MRPLLLTHYFFILIDDDFGWCRNSKREITDVLARADEDSAAIKLSTLGNIASIGGSVISAIHNLFSSGSQQQKREFLEILQRAAVEDGFVARSLNELD